MSRSKDKKVRQALRRSQREHNVSFIEELKLVVRDKPKYVPKKLWDKIVFYLLRVEKDGEQYRVRPR